LESRALPCVKQAAISCKFIPAESLPSPNYTCSRSSITKRGWHRITDPIPRLQTPRNLCPVNPELPSKLHRLPALRIRHQITIHRHPWRSLPRYITIVIQGNSIENSTTWRRTLTSIMDHLKISIGEGSNIISTIINLHPSLELFMCRHLPSMMTIAYLMLVSVP